MDIEKQKKVFVSNLQRYLDEGGKMKKDIAAHLNISAGTVSDWCKLRSYPRMDKIQKLAEYFGVTTDYLLGISDVKTSDAEKKVVCEYAYLTKVIIKAVREEIAKLEKHAHWNVGYFHDRVCSRCCHPDNDIDEYPHQYCPNCGAKMGEENL